MVTEAHHERRSICVEEFKYNPDGTIPKLPFWSETGIEPVGTLDPFKRTEAETIAWAQGLKTAKGANSMYVTAIDDGDYIKVRAVDLGKGAKKFEASIDAGTANGTIEVHLDSPEGTLLGSLKIKSTSGEGKWQTQSCRIAEYKGIHDVYFVFRGAGNNLFNFDWWKFSR